MTAKKYIPEDADYTPDEVVVDGIDRVEKIRSGKLTAAKLNIKGIKDYFAPVMPGELTAVIAQTSHYKSGFLHFWERQLAQQLLDEGRDDEAIIHVSVEELIEEQAFLEFARETGEDAGKIARGDVQDWDKLLSASAKIAGIPIYRVGESLARAEDMPNLYLSNMVRSIKALTTGKVTGNPIKPAALFFDYLQAFPYDPEVKRAEMKDQRRLQVREDTDRLRLASASFSCPVIVGVQAKQILNKSARGGLDIPGMYDGEESSAIAQRFNRIITLYMPKHQYSVGEYFNFAGRELQVDENMLIIKIVKQRGGLPSGKAWMTRIDFLRNEISLDENLHSPAERLLRCE